MALVMKRTLFSSTLIDTVILCDLQTRYLRRRISNREIRHVCTHVCAHARADKMRLWFILPNIALLRLYRVIKAHVQMVKRRKDKYLLRKRFLHSNPADKSHVQMYRNKNETGVWLLTYLLACLLACLLARRSVGRHVASSSSSNLRNSHNRTVIGLL